jgi:ankyrin repeat protein
MQIRRVLILLLFQMAPFGIYAQSINEELIVATRKSKVEDVKTLLAKGADVNAKTEYGATPLFFACDRGNVEIVKILLDAGADVNITDTFYKSPPVFWAVIKDHGAIVKLLL